MADLALELLRRNARLRAWRATGLSFEGGWSLEENGVVWLELCCGQCEGFDQIGCLPSERDDGARLLGEILNSLSKQLCPHLLPLRGEDPPEVLAILELELVAGDSPR
jgi:hypothetical protein